MTVLFTRFNCRLKLSAVLPTSNRGAPSKKREKARRPFSLVVKGGNSRDSPGGTAPPKLSSEKKFELLALLQLALNSLLTCAAMAHVVPSVRVSISLAANTRSARLPLEVALTER